MGIAGGGCNFVDIIEKAFLLFSAQGQLVLEAGAAAGKAGVQVGVGRGEPSGVVRVDGQDDALVQLVVDLGQFVALVLVDDEQISGRNGVKPVVNKKLFPAGDGIIQLITVMDMHFHGFFFFIEMRNGKGSGAQAVFNCCFAGGYFFHVNQYNGEVQNLQGFEKYLNRPGYFFRLYW